MKIEPNMYVRTKKGTIHKIFEIDKILKYEKEDRLILNEDDWFLVESDLVKASHNIIDLIEEGDYVNGYKVIDFIYCGGGFTDIRKQGVRVDGEIWAFDYDEIKSIVTKEQFESMEYKINE